MPCDTVKSSDIENVDWSTGTGSGVHYTNVVRFGSSSSQASQSSGDMCRICHCESDPQNPLLTPCYCSGSLKYVHQTCLQQWLTASETNACELCKFPFIMHTKIKPFNEWRSLDISGVERRRLCCSILFHCAAALCVIWSLCVLIERVAEDVKRGLIDWPFWTKLAVVTVGLTGGVVFMYIKCKAYLHLCHRWRARNRILLIQNAPEKIHPLSPPSPVMRANNSLHNGNDITNRTNTSNSHNYNSFNYQSNASSSDETRIVNRLYGPNDNIVDNQRILENDTSRQSVSNIHYTDNNQSGQIVANIENTSHNYDRDWALDDVSQISSFRPCPQGSGSMTPFHDSIHNVLEHSQSGADSATGSQQDLNLSAAFPQNMPTNSNLRNEITNTTMNLYASKADTITSGEPYFNHHRHSNSSVFLENRDILNDSGYPKINYRHSSVLTSPDITDNLDKFLGKDLRRYSDTKLLTSDMNINPSLNNELQPFTLNAHSSNYNFDCGIQRQHDPKPYMIRPSDTNNPENKLRLSLNPITDKNDLIVVSGVNVNTPSTIGTDGNTISEGAKSEEQLVDKNRLFFQSLPNLNSSCESLIKK